jgi:translocator protein
VAFVVFLALCVAAAATGIVFRPGQWYANLNQPSWRPPNALFGPVWLVLYIMIATAGWLVWRQAGPRRRGPAARPLRAAAGAQRPPGPGSPFAAAARSRGLRHGRPLARHSRHHPGLPPDQPTAAWLLVPYLAWVSFALALNVKLWRLNPVASGA